MAISVPGRMSGGGERAAFGITGARGWVLGRGEMAEPWHVRCMRGEMWATVASDAFGLSFDEAIKS